MELLTQTHFKTFFITMLMVMLMVVLPKLGFKISNPSTLATLDQIKIKIPQIINNF